MKRLFFFLSSTVFLFSHFLCAQSPKAPSQPVTETFFGKEVTDRYRNLENMEDSNVVNWYKAQAVYTEAQLKKLPMRDAIFKELKSEEAKYKYSVETGDGFALFPVRRGKTIFYVKLFSGEQTGKLYTQMIGGNKDVLLYDPNKNNISSIFSVISGFSVSYDGSKISVVIIQQGNDIGKMLIIDTKLKKQVESFERIWAPADWIDNESFTYWQLQSADVHTQGLFSNVVAKRHRIGNNISVDPVLLSYKQNPDVVPDSTSFIPRVYTSHEDAKFIIGHISDAEKFHNVYLSVFDNKSNSAFNWYPFIKKEDKITNYILQGDKVFGLSIKDNKNGRILLTSAANPDWDHAQIIAEAVKGSIDNLNVPFILAKDYLYYIETWGVEQKLYRVNLKGVPKVRNVKIPITGAIVPRSESPLDSNVMIHVASWIQPALLYDYNPSKDLVTKSLFQLNPSAKGGVINIETEIVYVDSPDGTKVPLSLIKPKGIKKDGAHTVLLFGYGHYGITINPYFDVGSNVFARHDIIYAVAHVRGGGEFGEEWRLGGFKNTKPNTWKDAIACAEYLIKERYTKPSRMALIGGSAGGILVGRAITERPDLFAVAIPRFGVMNPLRSEFMPEGPAHVMQFGTVTNEDDFKNLFEMDSYIHIENKVKYPATLIIGGFNDPRVNISQPGKFAARLQEASSSGKPVWFRIDMKGGHNQGTTKDQELIETADILSFILWQTKN